MTVADYWEVGASGAVYDRQTLLDELERRFADPAYDPMEGLELTDFAVREAGTDVWLATYALRQGDRHVAPRVGLATVRRRLDPRVSPGHGDVARLDP